MMRARRMTGTARGRASAAARLTGYLLQAKNDPPWIGTALASRDRHCPVLAREGQFLLDPFSFEKQALAVGGEERLGKTKQTVKRCAGAGGHDVDRVRQNCFDAAGAKGRGDPGDAYRFAQESAFSRIGFDQLDTGHSKDRQNQSGETGAAAEIDHA